MFVYVCVCGDCYDYYVLQNVYWNETHSMKLGRVMMRRKNIKKKQEKESNKLLCDGCFNKQKKSEYTTIAYHTTNIQFRWNLIIINFDWHLTVYMFGIQISWSLFFVNILYMQLGTCESIYNFVVCVFLLFLSRDLLTLHLILFSCLEVLDNLNKF